MLISRRKTKQAIMIDEICLLNDLTPGNKANQPEGFEITVKVKTGDDPSYCD